MSSETAVEVKVGQLLPLDDAEGEQPAATPPTATDVEPPARTANSETLKPLCGYLMKQSAKLPIKMWKTRWFRFDEKRCCLFYYNEKNDTNPQGKIDISMATLSYEIENLSKFQFEILSEGRSTSLQASSNEAMMYWLTQLQNKRRKFSSKRPQTQGGSDTDKPLPADQSSGLVGASGSQENLLSPDRETTPLDNPLAPSTPPTDLEDREAFSSEQTLMHSRTLSQKFRKLRFKQSPSFTKKALNKLPIKEEAELMVNGNSPPEEGQSAVNSEPSQPPESRPTRRSISFWKRPDPTPCPHCAELQKTMSILKNDLQIKEREVNDRDEINEFLRNEIRMTDLRDKVKSDLSQSSDGPRDDKTVDILLQREQTIEQLQKLLEQAIGERDRASTELQAKRSEVAALGEQVALFKEALVAKDHVVIELTNKVFQLEHKGQMPNNPQDVMLPMTGKSYAEEIHKLEETVEAYKQQNWFLSSELVELNAVRGGDREHFRSLENKLHELEAQHFRLQSKHMILLQESQQPRMDSELGPDTSVVTQMLEEALMTDDKAPAAVTDTSYDRYGFSHTHAASDIGYLMDPLTMKARKLDQEAHRAMDETVKRKRERWEVLLNSGRELQRNEDLKQLIRKGIPRAYRSQVWNWMIKQRLGPKYKEGEYQSILQTYSGRTSIAVNQIELDLLRTLPTNKFYDSPDAQGIDKLRHVLVAFSWYDQNVGYCQGLNRLAAIALLFLDEADAFWCLVAIVQHLLPNDYYSNTLLGSQTDQRVLMDLLQDHASKLYNHLSVCDIDLSMITFNWFHTIFVDNLPVETMLRIWDTFLYEGSKVLFRFAIAIFKYNEEDLLNIENSIGIFNRLRAMCQDATDINRLAHIAFTEIGTFRMKTITTKRNHYRLEIKAELEALEQMRSSSAHVVRPIRPVRKEIAKDDKEDSGSEQPLSSDHSPSIMRYSKKEVTKEERGGNEKEENVDTDSDVEETVYLP